MMNSLETHKYVSDYNWDDDLSPLFQIIENPETEYGTALLIYWRTGAPWLSEIDLEKHPKIETLVKKLKINLMTDFYTLRSIEYYPIQSESINKMQLSKLRKAGIPEELIEPKYGV